MINPVEGLNNLAAISQVDRRKERKQKEEQNKKKKENSFEEKQDDQFENDNEITTSEHQIDFKA
jgi:hypothetical protein